MTAVALTGPDGSTALGFLCSIGLLDVLTARAGPGQQPRLTWTWEQAWRPTIHEGGSVEQMIELILADRDTWDDSTVMGWTYGKSVRDLKPPPDVARRWLRDAAKGKRRNADLACALVGDVATDGKGEACKPTAFHFTAGKQRLLTAALEIRASLSAETCQMALLGPWIGDTSIKSLNWGVDGAREYALRAINPADDTKPCVVAAEWLALLGLSLLPAFPAGGRLHTTTVRGGHKTSTMTWPIWRPALSLSEARHLIACPSWLRGEAASARRAMGIDAVFSSAIGRSDQGGYGSFSPSQPA